MPISDPDLYYAEANIFALTSREDPFPSVVLQALEVGVPVVAFAGTGGCCYLIAQGCGLLAPAFDLDAYAARILERLGNEAQARSLGEEGACCIREDFSFRNYLYDVADWLRLPLRREFAIEEETRKRAEAYAQKLSRDFGRNRSGMDTYRQDPRIYAGSDEEGV